MEDKIKRTRTIERLKEKLKENDEYIAENGDNSRKDFSGYSNYLRNRIKLLKEKIKGEE